MTRAELAETTPRGLTVADVAEVFQVSRKTVYRMIHDGRIPAVRIGPQNYRIPSSFVAAVFAYARDALA